MRKLAALLLLVVAVSLAADSAIANERPTPNSADAGAIAVEAVQVTELPVSVHEVVLAKTRRGYVLRCSVSNNSSDQIIGLDYVLLVIDSNDATRKVFNAMEGFKLKGYATKTFNFQSPLRFEVSDGDRLFLMPHRVFSREYVWEVLKVKKALEAYASGDYSVTPEVVRVLNLYDAPPQTRIIY